MSGKKTDMTTKEKPVKAADGGKIASGKPAVKKSATVKEAAKKSAATNGTKKTAPAKEEAKQSVPVKSSTKKPSDDKAAATKTSDKKDPAAKAAEAAKAPKKATAEPVEAKAKNAAKSRKKAESAQEPKSTEPSSKTPQVMKLVQQRNDMVNPTIMAGKSSIPSKLRGLEPLSRIMKREADAVFGGDEPETYNLTALVIEDNAADILRRFNACDCELCVETLTRLTSEVVPARFVKLKKQDVERNAPEVKKLKAPMKKTVTSRMVRLVMQNKKRSYHD